MDFSGTQPASLLSVGNLARGLLFYSNDIDDYTDINVAEVFFDAEQLSLVNRVRYGSPQFHGFQISGSTGANQRSDVTLRWKDVIGDLLVSGAASYQRNTFGVADWRVDGGLGTLHTPSGLSLFFGGARSEDADDGRHFDSLVVKAGWRKEWFAFGETKLSADFTRTWDVAEN